MNIETKDIITLDDGNKYVVCGKVYYINDYYLYLVDMNELSNVKFGLEKHSDKGISIVEIEDKQLIQTLLPLFGKQAIDT